MGDFYEMFYEDAITAAQELEITLTARGKGEKRAPLAGVPYHAIESYLGRLVKKGYKVAIIEQLEDPKQAKGLVKRGLVRIVTPGTVIESSLLNEKENSYIMAISAYGNEYAVALCDVSTGEFFTTIITSTTTLMSELTRYAPRECIIPQSLQVNTELVDTIKAMGCFITPLDDYFFTHEKAQVTIVNHFTMPHAIESFGLADRRNVAVSGALLQYLTDTQKNALTHIKHIAVRNYRQHMILDASTFRNLELLKNISDGSSRGTLLSVLDRTVTAMGSRLMKKWIREPLLDPSLINRRLDAITALNSNVILREELIALLKQVADIERLIGRMNYGTAHARDLLALSQSLQQAPLIKEKLRDSPSQLLADIANCPGLEDVTSLITHAIRDNPPVSVRDGGIIIPSYHKELEELYAVKKNSKQYLQELEERERQKTGIQNLRITYNRVFGYFIEVTRKHAHLVPDYYLRKQTTAHTERYITEELKIEEEKILGADEKIKELEYDIFQDIIKNVTEKTADIQHTAAQLAILDVLCSLATVAMDYHYVRPELTTESSIHIEAGRHPVVERIEPRFVANDVFLHPGEMMIITGPNMSGKSTLMRQVALIVLMAQIGSFVPASRARLCIVDRIFTRVGAYDDLSSGQSTFMVEMNETAAILHNATKDSLIILDEIGRGTSTFDGVSIAWSVAEHIHQVIQAKTLFSTHYHVMNKLAEKFSRIKNYNLAVREVGNEIIFLRKLIEGGTDQSYGIHVARLAGLPLEVVERAKEIQQILEKDDDMVRKIKAKKLQEQMNLEKFT
jgi:DNA mismatch repair protein MutS